MLHLIGVTPARVVAAGALAFANMAAPAQARTHNPDTLASGQLAQVGQICKTVIRVWTQEAHYDACVSSLSESLRSASQDLAVRTTRTDCLGKGLEPGSSDLAECVLKSAETQAFSTAAKAADPVIRNAGGIEEPGSSRSYFYASPHEVFRREQSSCARLGFDPAYGAFASCVANLAGALDAIDRPMN